MTTFDVTLPPVQVKGLYRLEVRRPDGSLKWDIGWIDNLITDAGLEALGQPVTLFAYCMVGEGNTAPAVTDTALQTQVAYRAGGFGTTSAGIVTSSPRYGWQRVTFPFVQGAVIGNIAEVGIGWTTTAVFSRSLVSPAAPIGSIDQLTVTYELRMYLPTADVTGSKTIGGTSYNYTIRAIKAASSSYAGQSSFGWAPNPNGLGASAREWTTTNGFAGYAGACYGPTAQLSTNIEDVALQLSGGGTASTSAPSSVSNAAYAANSLECQFTHTWGASAANFGGIQGFIYSGFFGTYQCVLDAALPKDNTKELQMTWKQTWARRP